MVNEIIPKPTDIDTNLVGYFAGGGINNLNLNESSMNGKQFLVAPYIWNADNRPADGPGVVITTIYNYSNLRGTQLALAAEYNGVYYRKVYNGSWSSWIQLAPLTKTALSQNFNDFTTDGDIFWVNPSWTNGPGVGDNGFLKVHAYSGYIAQEFINISGTIKTRGYNPATGWSSWK